MSTLRRLARRSLPKTAGTLTLSCLEDRVEVIRDRFGFAHIYASSRRDLARAQGYVHAQDRLFQMETIRRFAFGRLSELAGGRALDLDRAARRLRLRWAAEQDAAACDPESAAILAAYCDGVNEFLAHGPLPLELRIARTRPEPWTIVDVHAPAQMFALILSGNWENEIARARLRARVSEERFRRLDPSYPDDHPVVVPDELLARVAETTRNLRGRVGTGASNSWVVGSSRSASGKPLLANDPHLLLGLPSLWHVQHVVWDGGEVAGFTVPGAPVVVLGRNGRVAWGMTTAMIDTQDVFVERFHRDDPYRYEADGEWAEAEVMREEIHVRGRKAPVVEEVVVTRHGPVVARVDSGREALALRWSAYEPGETTRSLFDLMDARSVDEADRALDRFAAPPHNFVLADSEGAIAYRLAGGPIPRRVGDGRVPVRGWDSSHEWDGWIAEHELPRFRGPDDGVIVTANNRVVGDEHAQELAGEYLTGYRAMRIETLLEELDAVTAGDCGRIQLDVLSLPGLELAAIARGFSAADPLERRALELLAAWNGRLDAESAGGAVYAALAEALDREAYAEAAADPLVPTEPQALPAGLFERGRPALLRSLAARDDSFFGDGRTWEGVFRRALREAVRGLGPDPRTWRRGRTHRIRFAHAFDGLPGLTRLFSRGAYPVGGDADTVNVAAAAAGAAPGSMIGASMRAVFDLGDRNGNHVVTAPGQSGHVASPHYDDLIPRWLAGELLPLPLDRDRVDALAQARLVLEPAGEPE